MHMDPRRAAAAALFLLIFTLILQEDYGTIGFEVRACF
jgi:hypothetical protein